MPYCVLQNGPKNRAALTFSYIQIEEIAVKDGLHHPGNDGNHVKESLWVEPPYPVDEVEGSVESQEEKVVRGDGLSFTSLADHEKLGQDGHWLQIDWECPQNLLPKKREDIVLVENKRIHTPVRCRKGIPQH